MGCRAPDVGGVEGYGRLDTEEKNTSGENHVVWVATWHGLLLVVSDWKNWSM